MSVNYNPTSSLEAAIETYRTDINKNYLAYREIDGQRQWVCLKRINDAGAAIAQNAVETRQYTIGSISLCIEEDSLAAFDPPCVQLISRMFGAEHTEAFEFEELYTQHTLEELVGEINTLKQEASNTDTPLDPSRLESLKRQIRAIELSKQRSSGFSEFESRETSKQSLNDLLKVANYMTRMIDAIERAKAPPATAAAPAALAPVVDPFEALGEFNARIADEEAASARLEQRQERMSEEATAEASKAIIAELLEEFTTLSTTQLGETQSTLEALIFRTHKAEISETVLSPLRKFDAGSFPRFDIFNESEDLERFQIAQRYYDQNLETLERLRTELTQAINNFKRERDQIIAQAGELVNAPDIQEFAKRLNFRIQILEDQNRALDPIEKDIKTHCLYPKIMNRYAQRQAILVQACSALDEYQGKTPGVLSINQEGHLAIEPKPFFNRGEKIESMAFNGMNVFYRVGSKTALDQLFTLAALPENEHEANMICKGNRERFLEAIKKHSK